jgi:hypothetical protein
LFNNSERVAIKTKRQTAPSCKIITLQQEFTGKQDSALFDFYTYKTAKSTNLGLPIKNVSRSNRRNLGHQQLVSKFLFQLLCSSSFAKLGGYLRFNCYCLWLQRPWALTLLSPELLRSSDFANLVAINNSFVSLHNC